MYVPYTNMVEATLCAVRYGTVPKQVRLGSVTLYVPVGDRARAQTHDACRAPIEHMLQWPDHRPLDLPVSLPACGVSTVPAFVTGIAHIANAPTSRSHLRPCRCPCPPSRLRRQTPRRRRRRPLPPLVLPLALLPPAAQWRALPGQVQRSR